MVLIFSPQKWSHQFISKHHYAIAFSEKNKTLFFEPIICKLGRFKINILNPVKENQNLNVIQIIVPWPGFVRFHAKVFFRKINTYIIRNIVKRYSEGITILIDFGYYQAISNWAFIACNKKIFFPVDDFDSLPVNKRGCNKFFTVSENIQEKFEQFNIPITWINHGLSSVFAEKAKVKLAELKKEKDPKKYVCNKIGYAGNLTIPFLDRMAVLNTISSLPDFTFHFFGNYANNDKDAQEFIRILKQQQNVILHGQLSTEKLAEQLFQIDILWLCYKADGKNYHLENSHKILEYLATGLPIVSTPIKYLKEAEPDFIYQSQNINHAEVIKDLKNKKEDLEIIIQRIKFSLKATYWENIKKIISQ